MRKSRGIWAALFLVLTLWASVAWAELPFHLQFVVKHLVKHGYTLLEEGQGPPDVLGFVSYRTAVALGVDNSGLRSGTVLFLPGHGRNAYDALGGIYVALQVRMGKLDSILSEGAAHRKGRYLMDAISHNLKLSDETEFLFDDMVVQATKDRKSHSITVRLKLWRH